MRKVSVIFVFVLLIHSSLAFAGTPNVQGKYSGSAAIADYNGFYNSSVTVSITSQNGTLFRGTATILGTTFSIYGRISGQNLTAVTSGAEMTGKANSSFSTFTFTIKCTYTSHPYIATCKLTKQ